MKSVLLYNHGGCENHGCEAIVRATSELFDRYAGVRSHLASATPQYDQTVGLAKIDRIFSWMISPHSFARLVN